MTLIGGILLEPTTADSLLVSFLIRVIFELHQDHPNPSNVGLVNFDSQNLSYIPTELMKHVTDVTFLNIDIKEQRTETKAIQYAPILVHAFGISKPNGPSEESPIQSEVLKILEYFKLIEKTKNIIVLLDAYGVKPTELDLLAKTYQHFGAIDIIYVLLKMKEPIVIRLNDMSTEFVKLSTFAKIEQLFPDRLANMSGRPYKVACLENPPLSFRSPATNRTIGIDVEFIDMIAKHQHTVADYRYTAQPIELFEPWHSTEIDFATYRIILTEQAYKFALLFLPNQYLWCLAVPKTYNRILHQQILWPYTTDMWLLIGTIVICFLLYRLLLKHTLQRRHPNAFPIINTPLHILRILLLFLLSEYYTALLSSNLGLSKLPAYPRTFEQFKKSTIPLIVHRPESYEFLRNNEDLMSRTIRWNFSQRYDPTRLAVVQLCDLFPYTIRATTRLVGKELSHHHYHLIEKPVKCAICMSPFRQTSPLLSRFQMYVRRLYEAGVWDFVVRKWTSFPMQPIGFEALDSSMLKLEHFAPVYIVGGYLYLLCVGVFLLEIITHRILRRLNGH